MIVQLSAKVSLFLYVRTHSQVEYYLNLADSSRAANDVGVPGGDCSERVNERAHGASNNVVRLRTAIT
jgi:hypothetical protein